MEPKAKQSPEFVVREIPAVSSVLKRKSGSYWKD